MNNYYKFIHIPTTLFNQVEVEKELCEIVKVSNNPAGRQVRHWPWGTSPFNAEAYQWIESMGLKIGMAEIFYTKPYQKEIALKLIQVIIIRGFNKKAKKEE